MEPTEEDGYMEFKLIEGTDFFNLAENGAKIIKGLVEDGQSIHEHDIFDFAAGLIVALSDEALLKTLNEYQNALLFDEVVVEGETSVIEVIAWAAYARLVDVLFAWMEEEGIEFAEPEEEPSDDFEPANN